RRLILRKTVVQQPTRADIPEGERLAAICIASCDQSSSIRRKPILYGPIHAQGADGFGQLSRFQVQKTEIRAIACSSMQHDGFAVRLHAAAMARRINSAHHSSGFKVPDVDSRSGTRLLWN